MSRTPEPESEDDLLNPGAVETPTIEKMDVDQDSRPISDSPATTPTLDQVTPPLGPSSTKRGSNNKATPAPKAKPAPPQLIPDLPVATEKALKTFEELTANHYQYGTLGRSQEELESMTCDCTWDGGALHLNFEQSTYIYWYLCYLLSPLTMIRIFHTCCTN